MKPKPPSTYPDCYKCGKPVKAREDQLVVRFEGEETLFQRVPMGVCAGCGERFLTAATARRMEEAQVLCGRAFDTSPGALRTLREGLRLSREALAVKLGVSAQTLFRWETGRSRPRAAAAKRLDALRRKARSKRRAG